MCKKPQFHVANPVLPLFASQVTTTLGRSHFFGICGLITFPRYGDFRWMCLVPPGAVCAGLSYDAEGAAVGASWRPGAGGPVVTPVGIYCELPGKLTLASLADTSKIEVRCVRESGWPLGALVTHSDGGAEALGDFQPGSCSCHPVTTLYEAATDGPLLGLAFKYSRGSYGIVCAIEAVTPSSPAPDDWVVIGNMVSNVPRHLKIRPFRLLRVSPFLLIRGAKGVQDVATFLSLYLSTW